MTAYPDLATVLEDHPGWPACASTIISLAHSSSAAPSLPSSLPCSLPASLPLCLPASLHSSSLHLWLLCVFAAAATSGGCDRSPAATDAGAAAPQTTR